MKYYKIVPSSAPVERIFSFGIEKIILEIKYLFIITNKTKHKNEGVFFK